MGIAKALSVLKKEVLFRRRMLVIRNAAQVVEQYGGLTVQAQVHAVIILRESAIDKAVNVAEDDSAVYPNSRY